MASQSALEDNIEGIFDAFFNSGAHHGDLHTLDLQGIDGDHDKQRIEQVLAEVDQVKGVRVNVADNKVFVLCPGPVTDVVTALERAGFVFESTH